MSIRASFSRWVRSVDPSRLNRSAIILAVTTIRAGAPPANSQSTPNVICSIPTPVFFRNGVRVVPNVHDVILERRSYSTADVPSTNRLGDQSQ